MFNIWSSHQLHSSECLWWKLPLDIHESTCCVDLEKRNPLSVVVEFLSHIVSRFLKRTALGLWKRSFLSRSRLLQHVQHNNWNNFLLPIWVLSPIFILQLAQWGRRSLTLQLNLTPSSPFWAASEIKLVVVITFKKQIKRRRKLRVKWNPGGKQVDCDWPDSSSNFDPLLCLPLKPKLFSSSSLSSEAGWDLRDKTIKNC